MASYIKTIARQVRHIKSWIYESARNLYRGRNSLPDGVSFDSLSVSMQYHAC